MTTEIPFQPLPADDADVRYLHGPDSSPHDDVPAGTVTELRLDDSTTYPGTRRAVRVHVPAAYDEAQPASLVVFQDGDGFLDPDDDLRAGVVLDNLVHRGDLPPTIGVFVDAGVVTDAEPRPDGRNRQRNVEYDASDDRYVRFLVDDVLPEVSRRWSVTDDPARRAIAGFSSGASCAFTAAWHRSDVFGRVVCLLPSFAQVPGGNPYPALVAATPRRPLRVLVQAARRDLGWDEPTDNWLVENLRTVAALTEAGYDVRLVLGEGGHTSDHGGALLPDALRWVFRAE